MPESVFILSAGSDIGRELAERYLAAGHQVAGTYRSERSVAELEPHPNLHLFKCDLADPPSIRAALSAFREEVGVWDTFISSAGTEEPIGPFFECDFDEWEQSVIVNASAQLRVLHGLYPLRRPGKLNHAMFFAGGGTNNPFRNYSAYCISKIFLIKVCELLDDENDDLNVFIVGPGFVRTKIHRQTLCRPQLAGPNYEKTRAWVESDEPGTSFDDIYECIEWCKALGKRGAGGRNFSIVHDQWRDGGAALTEALLQDTDKFKLRRHGNGVLTR